MAYIFLGKVTEFQEKSFVVSVLWSKSHQERDEKHLNESLIDTLPGEPKDDGHVTTIPTKC